MDSVLNIRPAGGALDLLSLGALVHRLDPGIIPFRKAAECQIHVSGGEYNVAANLADCFRLNTGIAIPALPGAIPTGLNADSNRWQHAALPSTRLTRRSPTSPT